MHGLNTIKRLNGEPPKPQSRWGRMKERLEKLNDFMEDLGQGLAPLGPALLIGLAIYYILKGGN